MLHACHIMYVHSLVCLLCSVAFLSTHSLFSLPSPHLLLTLPLSALHTFSPSTFRFLSLSLSLALSLPPFLHIPGDNFLFLNKLS